MPEKIFKNENDFKTYQSKGMYGFLFNDENHSFSLSNKENATSHFISLQPDKELNELNFSFDLQNINLQPHYRTFEITIHRSDNHTSKQIVQLEEFSEKQNRVIYQISLIDEQSLREGTQPSVKTKEKVKNKGEYGDDGGHYVAKQLGGLGWEYNLFPQNLFVNRHSMLQLENTIRQEVENKKMVLYSHLAIYDKKEERPKEIHFKVTTSNGKLLHYGIIDNPPQVPTLLDFIARNFEKCWKDTDTGRPYIIDLNVELFVTILASKRLKHKNEFVLEVIQKYLSCDKYKDIRSSKQLIEIIESCSECFTTEYIKTKNLRNNILELYANLLKEEQEKLENVLTKMENQDVDDITNSLNKTSL